VTTRDFFHKGGNYFLVSVCHLFWSGNIITCWAEFLSTDNIDVIFALIPRVSQPQVPQIFKKNSKEIIQIFFSCKKGMLWHATSACGDFAYLVSGHHTN
jgi:hypothetical protein